MGGQLEKERLPGEVTDSLETAGDDLKSAGLDFREILDSLADPIVAADITNRIVYANCGVADLLGWQPEELVGQPLTVLMPERFRPLHIEGFERFLRTRQARIIGHPIQVPALRRDGVEIPIELAISVREDPDELLFVASLRDLRERVELERQLKVTRYLQATTAAAARLTTHLNVQQLLNTVVDALVDDFGAALARVWIYDPECAMLHLQASAGLTTTTTGSSREWIDVATYPYKVGHVARSKTPFIRNGLLGDEQFDQAWVTTERIQSVAVFPLLHAGNLLGVLAFFAREPLPDELIQALSTFISLITTSLNDVTLFQREQEARAENARLYAELQATMRAREDFLSSVSHDLKNPLTALRGYAQLLQRRLNRLPPEESASWGRNLTAIETTTEKMFRLLSDLVEVAQNRAEPETEFQPGPVDLVALARAVAAEFQQTTDHHRIEVKSAVPSVHGVWDATGLERVLGNLLSNAIKYSPEGGAVSIGIDVEEDHGRSMAVVCVKDEGIGIPEREIDRIFERFQRGSNVTGKIAGTGIGLAGARRIVERHGGQIRVSSQEGAGSTFTVELPL